ncbi:hypothetical protein GH714_039864 [Hevea brasiliensis]|uniref:Leucine-rich repeat-containing N-terminal plant-type domain-containing protein n=1 Tax=Hevea brasiliensis TaxID=3981 RepID=A0A6A6KEX1_HEVBR|nr:hypothetical protein GH714_039864 [Hevea brasiliensis]
MQIGTFNSEEYFHHRKIPPLANLSFLEVLDLGDNSLQGPLQGVPPSIKSFSIAGNNISGQDLFLNASNSTHLKLSPIEELGVMWISIAK